MTLCRKTFYQSHDCAGFAAKITVEWSWPEGSEPPQNWRDRAEEIAEQVFAEAGPRAFDISRALRGHGEEQKR